MKASLDPIAILRRHVADAGTAQRFAQDHGVSAQHVGDVLRGRRAPGPRILAAIGLTKVTIYRKAPPCSTP